MIEPNALCDRQITELARHGIVAVEPAIRASDYRLALSDPFLYYLIRRLGFCNPLSVSDALTTGTWFHEAAFHDDLISDTFPDDSEQDYLKKLKARKQEIKKTCQLFAYSPDATQSALDREERLAMTALTQWKVLRGFRFTSRYAHLIAYLNQPGLRIVAREKLMAVPFQGGVPGVFRPDLLLYNEKENAVWVVDYKSTAATPQTRLSICPIEFQSQLYLYYAACISHYGLFPDIIPPHSRIAGIIHVALQKCPLKFGMKDRSYVEREKTLSRGPRKGQVVIERDYHGQPNLSNYTNRIREWYLGTGPYADELPNRLSDPPINISELPTSAVFNNAHYGTGQFFQRFQYIAQLATRIPYPSAFLSNESTALDKGVVSPYAPFYVSPVSAWPSLVASHGFISHHRDAKETHHAINQARQQAKQNEEQIPFPTTPEEIFKVVFPATRD